MTIQYLISLKKNTIFSRRVLDFIELNNFILIKTKIEIYTYTITKKRKEIYTYTFI